MVCMSSQIFNKESQSIMTARDRLLGSFRCLKVDRIPVSPFIWINFVNWFFSTNFSLADEILDEKLFEVSRLIGFDPIVRTCGAISANTLESSSGWDVHTEYSSPSPNNRVEKITIKTSAGSLSQSMGLKKVTPYDELSAETEHFIKTPQDLELFMRHQPHSDALDYSRITRCREMVGDDGITAPWLQGVFNTCARLAGLENMMIWTYEQPEEYREFMRYNTKRIADRGIQMARAGADVISYEGNMATATMVGPAFFREFVLEYEKEAIKEIRSAGAEVLYHNCGDCNALLSVYNDLGITALESLTPPPFGDCDIHHAKAVLSKNIAVSGNIDQIEFLLSSSPQEVFNSAQALIKIWKDRGGFILATSDYLMEGTPMENLRSLVNAAHELGCYDVQ